MEVPQSSGIAVPPREIAKLVEQVGVAKAKTDGLTLFVLAILAGAYISLGASLYLVAITGSSIGIGPTRLLGGLSFCLGLILVVVAGAELFTGNNLIAMAWASGRIRFTQVVRNWVIVYLGNVCGCLATVTLVSWSELGSLAGGGVSQMAVQVAEGKTALGWSVVLARGTLCNALVCVAVWLTFGARSVTDKILAIIFPITAFVALGLEHSIANWFFLPFAWTLDSGHSINAFGMFRNLVASTIGNILGGTLLVAGIYWIAFLRKDDRSQ